MTLFERSDAELIAATEAMYRIRAVESPPDAKGQRTIWHRAPKNAELVTWVDADGRAERQELQLFDDILLWDRAGGFQTGSMVALGRERAHKPSESMTLDQSLDSARIGRITRALSSYQGTDRYISHVLQVLASRAAHGFEDQVTSPTNHLRGKLSLERVPTAAAPGRLPLIFAGVIGLIVLLAVVLLLMFVVLM